MANKQNLKKLKLIALAMACVVSTSALSFTACEEEKKPSDDSTTAVTKVDSQLLKNGNFEFYSENSSDDVDPYLIAGANNWSATALGTSSYVKSGIIDTSEEAWTRMSNEELAENLDYNNNLKADAEDYEDLYVDYNGMKSSDILYKNTKAALEDKATAEDKELIENPYTHDEIVKSGNSAYYTDEEGNRVDLYEKDGKYYLDEDYEKPYQSHVLMLHNYLNSNRNGTAQKYSSSTTITLEANMSAEVSLWVKTTNLVYNDGQTVHQDRGAFVEVSHTVGSTKVDSMYINNINTEKLNPKPASGAWTNNGWVQYTIYVQGCDYASSSFSLSLGLGQTGANLVEGYAFFDDVQVTKYKSLEETGINTTNVKTDANGYVDKENGGTTCTLLSSAENKVFEADTAQYENFNKRFSENFHYLLDLTASSSKSEVLLGANTVTANVTKDANDFVPLANTNATLIGVTKNDYSASQTYVNNSLANLNTNLDIVANVNFGDENTLNTTFAASNYKSLLVDQLKTATTLPGVETTTSAVVILSAGGAPYTANVANNEFTLAAESRTILSFWLKTSQMDNKSAATLKLKDTSDEDNVATITVDTTGIETSIGEEKNIYNGWVECFFFVENNADVAKTFTLDFSFGTTTIKDTTYSSYSYGYAMIANMHTLSVDEDEFGYASSTSYTANLTFGEDEKSEGAVFDAVYGSQTQYVKNNIATPASYMGTNGGSTSIVPSEGELGEYDEFNLNENAGLVNKEYFANYIQNLADDTTNPKYNWLKVVLDAKNYTDYASAVANAEQIWSEVFGDKCTQPLLIVNTVRDYANNQSAINYGYVGKNAAIAADGYIAVSVKVKASAGGVAYVYLIDNKTKDVFAYQGNGYTFWYDDEGNVLKGDPDTEGVTTLDNLAYALRNDGLYEQYGADDGKLYANVYNYGKEYFDESETYFTKDGTAVKFEDLDNSQTYYNSASATTLAKHYLVADDATRVYQYDNGKYFYVENGKTTDEVLPFDLSLATPRYDTSAVKEQYVQVVDTIKYPELADKWITVNFYIHAGEVAKSYRVEVWSGERTMSGTAGGKVSYNGEEYNAASQEGSYVTFDYSYASIDASGFDNLVSEYEGKIAKAYKQLLADKGLLNLVESNTVNVNKLEAICDELVIEGKLTQDEVDAIKTYVAHYYTFTLYDSTTYVPFNEDTAGDGDGGYVYKVSDNQEKISYLAYSTETSAGKTYNVFADYSSMEQSVEKIEGEVDDEEDSDDGVEPAPDAMSIGLLVASILLVVALVFTLISLLVRRILKKHKKGGKKPASSSKKKRYIKRLKLAETVEEDPEE